jgi:hypothetical protein
MRIIGIEALIKLMEVNLSTSGKEVTEKIHTILKPIEYTRIDKIVDVIFTAAEDKDLEIDGAGEPLDYQDKPEQKTYATPQTTPREIIEQKKQVAIEVGFKLDKVLVRRNTPLCRSKWVFMQQSLYLKDTFVQRFLLVRLSRVN